MMKRILAAILLTAALAGCTVTTTKTSTSSTTDANGNTTSTTTTVTTGNNGTTSETTETVSYEANMSFVNDSGYAFEELYLTEADAETWGDELLGDNAPLASGEYINGTFRYDTDNMIWDLRFIDEDGDDVTVEGIDFGAVEDPQNITITITIDDEGYYTANVK